MGHAERVQISEAVRITGLKLRTLQNLSARGQVWGAAKLGKLWTYDERKLRAWVAANENAVMSRTTSMSVTGFSMPALRSMDAKLESRLKHALEEKLNAGSSHG